MDRQMQKKKTEKEKSRCAIVATGRRRRRTAPELPDRKPRASLCSAIPAPANPKPQTAILGLARLTSELQDALRRSPILPEDELEHWTNRLLEALEEWWEGVHAARAAIKTLRPNAPAGWAGNALLVIRSMVLALDLPDANPTQFDGISLVMLVGKARASSAIADRLTELGNRLQESALELEYVDCRRDGDEQASGALTNAVQPQIHETAMKILRVISASKVSMTLEQLAGYKGLSSRTETIRKHVNKTLIPRGFIERHEGEAGLFVTDAGQQYISHAQ
jgi:hypothetical protein